MRALSEYILASLETICGFYLDSVLDIGANSVSWISDLRSYFPPTEFFLIECSRHKPARMPFAIAVVGDIEKGVVFYRKDRDTGNSKFKQFNWKNMSESS